MDPRKATASVSYNGKRIDTKLAEYLQSFSYTDVASGESDSLSLNINAETGSGSSHGFQARETPWRPRLL